SLRTHKALKYFEWVEMIIAGQFEEARKLQEELKKERYMVKIVDSLDEAKNYVQKMYQGTDKTYGIVVSSDIKYPQGVKVSLIAIDTFNQNIMLLILIIQIHNIIVEI